jgi:hypothetical protein
MKEAELETAARLERRQPEEKIVPFSIGIST